eukprot:SAG31_NODE_8565_length_1429_cov_1.427068_1_plen_100_part_00
MRVAAAVRGQGAEDRHVLGGQGVATAVGLVRQVLVELAEVDRHVGCGRGGCGSSAGGVAAGGVACGGGSGGAAARPVRAEGRRPKHKPRASRGRPPIRI